MNEAIIKMLMLSEENKVERQLREDAERRRQEEARQQQITSRLRQEERDRRQLLEQQAANWSKAENVRAFVRALEQRLIAQDGSVDPARPDATWLAWAYKHADRLDPTQGDYLPNAIAELARKDQLKPWEEEEAFRRLHAG